MSLWSDLWLLYFNPDKLKKGTISRKKFQLERRYHVGGSAVKNAEAEVFLGVYIDSELNFSDQSKLRIGKANRIIGAIRRSLQFLNAFTFVTLYKSMVRYHLEYAVPIWFPCLQRDIDAVEEVQKRATKMLACTKELN